MTARPAEYDVVVIGGGPSALSETMHLASTKLRVLVVSEQFGGCMDILGDLSLQSYVPELELARAPVRLVDFMRSKTESRPTGHEYANYVRACFAALPTEQRRCRVDWIQKQQGRFAVHTSDTGGSNVLYARRLVLATGIRSKTPRPLVAGAVHLSCFEAYQRLTNQDLGCFAEREVCIIGSGNTAFQLAYSLARIAKRITLLATKYVGVYPIDSADRFALRAKSLQALELVEKTADEPRSIGPINIAGNRLAPIYFHVYDHLVLDDSTGRLRARISTPEIQAPVVVNSLRAALNKGFVDRVDEAHCVWSVAAANVTTVSAIGVEANPVESPWLDLVDTSSGFMRHTNGRTSIDGLYVTGCAAGYPSVNLMRPVFGVLGEEAQGCSL